MTQLPAPLSRFLIEFLTELAEERFDAAAARFPGWSVESLAELARTCEGRRFIVPAADFLMRADRLMVFDHRDGAGGYWCRVALLTDGSDQYAADIVFTRTGTDEYRVELSGVLDRREN